MPLLRYANANAPGPNPMEAGRFRRIANRPSLTVLNETEQSAKVGDQIFKTLNRKWLTETGVQAVELKFGEDRPFDADEVRQTLHHVIEGEGKRNGHLGGWGQTIVVRGELSDADNDRLRKIAAEFRIKPMEVTPGKKSVKAEEITQQLIEQNTAMLPTHDELDRLKEEIRGETEASRSAYPLMQMLARLLPDVAFTREQKAAGAHVRGTVALAMQTSPDPMKASPGTDMRQDLVEYKAEAGPDAPWGRRIDHIPVMGLGEKGKRIIQWWNGELNPDGKPGFSYTAHLDEVEARSKLVDKHLAKPGEKPVAPFGELIIPLGIITPDLRRQLEHKQLLPNHHVAAVHAIHLDKIPRQLALQVEAILQDPDFNNKIVQNWFHEQQDYQSRINVKSRLSQLESHDEYTKNHSVRVGKWMKKIAIIMDRLHRKNHGKPLFTREFINGLEESGYVHDLGKLAMQTELLHKEGVLSVGEREMIQKHPEFAEIILAENRFPLIQQNAGKHHHQRWDGTGYPVATFGEEYNDPVPWKDLQAKNKEDAERKAIQLASKDARTTLDAHHVQVEFNEQTGNYQYRAMRPLKGEEIPIEARIAALGDVLDAFILDRPYPRRVEKHNERFQMRRVFIEGYDYLKRWLPHLVRINPKTIREAVKSRDWKPIKPEFVRMLDWGKRQLSWETLAGAHDEEGKWQPGMLQKGHWIKHFDPNVAEVMQHITEKDLREIYPEVKGDDLPKPRTETEKFSLRKTLRQGTNYVKDWWPHLNRFRTTRDVQVTPPNPNVLIRKSEEGELQPAP